MPLSAPTEDEITDSSTSPESSKETEQSETELKTETKTESETYPDGSHRECEYCGLCDGGGRWFIGKVMENHLIMPLGTNCFEKNAAGDAGIDVWYKKVDGEERRLEAGEYVCVSYGGYIMESYPVQINSNEVRTVDIEFDEGHFEETTKDEGYKDPPSEQKKITDFMVNYGNFAVNMGDVEFFPIYGFAYSETYEYEDEFGTVAGICADGAGVSWYLEAIFNGEISDSDMPCITFDEEIYINLSGNQTLSACYIDIATKEKNYINLDELYSLPYGDYYIILYVSTRDASGSYGDDYVFKLLMRDNTPVIGDYVIVDMDTDRVYLEMPISKIKILLDEDEASWLNLADASLLIKADENLTGGNNEFDGALWLTNENGRIYLNSEIIVDKPVEEEDATVAGCLGHEHIFDKYCISK